MNPYIGRQEQILGVEEYRKTGGKGDGVRVLSVRNGRGLECLVTPDRCADLARVSFRGVNCGFFSAHGFVAPAYYDDRDDGFMRSFTGGFLTTCGLTTMGIPGEEDGERLPMHGRIGNTPAEHVSWDTDEKCVTVRAQVEENMIFGRKLTLRRTYTFPLDADRLILRDEVTNEGDRESPLMLLYHMNMGYPLLSESAELTTGAVRVEPRNARAAEGIGEWNRILPPQERFDEQCYYHCFDGSDEGWAQLYNPDAGIGVRIRFATDTLPLMTQWKMMGVRDYVMGLEPGNATPDGRARAREDGRLVTLRPGESRTMRICVDFLTRRG